MRQEQLKYLLYIKKYGSINKASQYLYTTPQNIGKSLKALENEWGVELVVSTKHGSFLTPEGLEAASMAEEILNKIDSFLSKYHNKEDIDVQDRISIMVARQTEIYDYVISLFKEKYPHVMLTIIEADSNNMFEFIHDKYSDCIGLGLCTTPYNKSKLVQKYTTSIKTMPLCDDFPVLLVKKDSELSKYNDISLKKLKDFTFGINAHFNMYNNLFVDLLSPYVNAKNVAFITDNSTRYIDGITKGDYIGIGSSSSVSINTLENNSFDIVKIKAAPHFCNCLLYNKNEVLTDGEKAFIKFCRKFFENYSAYQNITQCATDNEDCD